MTMFSANDTILITGCASGIGKALARRFHQQGLKVCATARRMEAIADLEAEGILTLPLDVCNPTQIDALRQELQARGLHVRMLVNNAGYGAMGALLDVPHSTWQDQFEVNLFAPAALVRTFAPDMVARRQGMVVNISSISGIAPTPFASPYCASKAAFNALSDSLRMELKPFGISVVTVQPGGIRSTFGESAGNKLSLPPDSLYQPVKAGILDRAQEGQKNAMPADQFADMVVRSLLSPNCPPVLRFGEKSILLPALKRLLPDRLLDAILSRRFKLNDLSAR
jgi:short-subunit dehydrogenase